MGMPCWDDAFDEGVNGPDLANICRNHLVDPALRTTTADWGDPDVTCDLCQSAGAFEFWLIVHEVELAIGRLFKHAEESYLPWDEVEERGEWMTTQDVLDQEIILGDAVTDDLLPSLSGAIEETWWLRDPEGELTPGDQHALGWAEFRRLLLEERRFFALDDPHPDDQWRIDSIQGTRPSEVLHRISDLLDAHDLYKLIEPGTLLWRGRISDQPKDSWGAADLASAPHPVAAQSRMSATGISAFYGADSVETAVAELQQEAPGWATVGAFTPVRPLLVADLTRERGLPSMFDPDFDRADERRFLVHFASEISSPLASRELVHLDYVPTQVVAEYLRFRHVPKGATATGFAGVDGIAYTSSKCQGTNIVIFADKYQCLSDHRRVVLVEAPVPHDFRERRLTRPQLLTWAGESLEHRPVGSDSVADA